jgi:chitinase
LTTILYSFADISTDTGTVVLADPWADEQKHYPGDSWSDTGNNLYGCLKQLDLLKIKQGYGSFSSQKSFTLTPFVIRNLKIVLSVGGWTYSQSGHFSFVTDAGKREAFVNSAVQLIKDYSCDRMYVQFSACDGLSNEQHTVTWTLSSQ